MNLFEHTIGDIRNYIEEKNCKTWIAAGPKNVWPAGGGKNVVLSDEMAVELGNPQMSSLSCLIWTEHLNLIADGKINLIGPDIKQSSGKSLPFGKIVLLGVGGFDEENTYDRCREMEAVRFSLDLKGYMMRAVSQYQREWSRISRDAVRNGFSFEILANTLKEEYLRKEYIHAVEFLFVTSGATDVDELREMTKNVSRTISAMDKMMNELQEDCDECEYNDVCDEAGELKKMKRHLETKKNNRYE